MYIDMKKYLKKKTNKERKKRADSIREIRRMVRLLVGQHDRDKDIAERRKKTIKVVVNND